MAETALTLAIGRLTPDGRWAGVRLAIDGWEAVLGQADGSVPRAATTGRRRPMLLAAAIAYFSEALPETGLDGEATQGDLAEVIRWLADSEPDRARAALLRDAIDAIDDGLAGDAVANLLIPLIADEQADPVDLLIGELLRPSRE